MIKEHSIRFLNGRAAFLDIPAHVDSGVGFSLTGRISLLSLALRFSTSLRHYKPYRFCIIAISSSLASTYRAMFLLTPEPAEPDIIVR